MTSTDLTHDIKTKLLMYYRFNRQYPYAATEAGPFNADVLVANDTELVEVEVKVSFRDFLKDFGKLKHELYKFPPNAENDTYLSQYHPNRFFYAAPPELAERIKVHLEETKLPYGLIAVTSGELRRVFGADKFCFVVRKARRIHDLPPSENARRAVVARMGSELITLRKFHHAAV